MAVRRVLRGSQMLRWANTLSARSAFKKMESRAHCGIGMCSRAVSGAYFPARGGNHVFSEFMQVVESLRRIIDNLKRIWKKG